MLWVSFIGTVALNKTLCFSHGSSSLGPCLLRAGQQCGGWQGGLLSPACLPADARSHKYNKIIIIEGLSLLQRLPPTTANQTYYHINNENHSLYDACHPEEPAALQTRQTSTADAWPPMSRKGVHCACMPFIQVIYRYTYILPQCFPDCFLFMISIQYITMNE